MCLDCIVLVGLAIRNDFETLETMRLMFFYLASILKYALHVLCITNYVYDQEDKDNQSCVPIEAGSRKQFAKFCAPTVQV